MPKTKTKKPAAKSARKIASATLRSAALPKKELIDVGSRFNLAALTEHASVVLAKVGAQNADAGADEHFAEYGFGAGWVSAVEGLVASIDDAGEAANAIAANALPTAAALTAALTAAKELRRQGVTVLAADPTRTGATATLSTGASVPATRRGLAKVATLVPVNAVTPSGTGKDFRAKAQAALKTLDAAAKTHGAAIGKLSPAASKVHATKGVLYKELKSAARVARTVTPSDSHLYAIASHTRVHERSRKRPAKTNGATASAPSTSATAAKA